MSFNAGNKDSAGAVFDVERKSCELYALEEVEEADFCTTGAAVALPVAAPAGEVDVSCAGVAAA